MNVGELIARLQAMPQDAQVGVVYDGAHHADVENVWPTKDGRVLLAGAAVVYSDWDRPEGAPSAKDDPYWRLP